MRKLPFNIRTIHLVGIGGIGMSGIAEILHATGYTVQGSDLSENQNVKRLKDLGVTVMTGHDGANVKNADVVVYSSAVKADNPEIIAAKSLRIPTLPRAEMLSELMRFKRSIAVGGSHGKTTTTSIIATIAKDAGHDPTIINGGIINSLRSNARFGNGEWAVVEADESDGSFLKLPSIINVVTNIDHEHMDHYKSFDDLIHAYQTFINNIPFYGLAVLCADDPHLMKIVPTDRRVVTYGLSDTADVSATNIRYKPEGTLFDVVFNNPISKKSETWKDIQIPMLGDHNIANTLASIAVARELGIDFETITGSLNNFSGVGRRFTKTGDVGGITIFDDYAHHPTEIAAVLKAAKQACRGNVIAVVQPHRFTRLQSLFSEFSSCFTDADKVLVTEVFTAGEQPIDGITHTTLVEAVKKQGHPDAQVLDNSRNLAKILANKVQPGDFILCMGAGSISKMAHDLPEQLQKHFCITLPTKKAQLS